MTTSISCSADYLTNSSRIVLHRDIVDRIETIAPFLRLDHDPYVVISGGKLYWMQDAYTTSDWFPYAYAHTVALITSATRSRSWSMRITGR